MTLRWSLGFGLEGIGLLTLRFPRLATLFLAVSLVLAGLSIPRIGFDGNIVNVIDTESQAFADFVTQATSFHDYSGDVAVIVRHDDLFTAETMEGMRNLHLDLTLEEGVDGVFSVFTLGDATGRNAQSVLPLEFTSDAQTRAAFEAMLMEQPAASAIVSLDRQAFLMLVRLQSEAHVSEGSLNARLDALRTSVAGLAPPGTDFSFSGMPQIRASIVSAIIRDQTVLSSAGIVLGCLVAWFIFGTLRAALICTIPAFLAVAWLLGLFSAFGTPLNFFTTALPILALIIAFADTIVLYFRWQSLNEQDGEKPFDNLRAAIRQIGPASSLTSITTALAFASFYWADSDAMDTLAFFGVAAVILSFLAVIIGLPLACWWGHGSRVRSMPSRKPRFAFLGDHLSGIVTRQPLATVGVSLALAGLFAMAHVALKPSYAISDYLPYDSEVRTSEAFADDVFGGTSQIYILLKVTEGRRFDDAENRARLKAVHDIAVSMFGEGRVLSLADGYDNANPQQISEIRTGLEQVSESVRGRFLSRDASLLQISAAASAGRSTLETEALAERLRGEFAQLPFAEDVSVTGLSVLLAEEFPKLIGDLRDGLIVSIFLAVFVVGIATRNPALAVASLLPNLIPILFTEAVIWSIGAALSVTNVIGLTIAFGIAIDNAVHVINAYEKLEQSGLELVDRVSKAVADIAPALLASTGIVCVSTLITQLSTMPSVSELGRLLIATLLVALVSNLVILPSAMILTLRATRARRKAIP